MLNVEIYTKSWCPFCAQAKDRLKQLGITFEEIDVTDDPGKELEMNVRSQRQTVPQIFVNGVHLGGNDDLLAADKSGRLDQLRALPEEATGSYKLAPLDITN